MTRQVAIVDSFALFELKTWRVKKKKKKKVIEVDKSESAWWWLRLLSFGVSFFFLKIRQNQPGLSMNPVLVFHRTNIKFLSGEQRTGACTRTDHAC